MTDDQKTTGTKKASTTKERDIVDAAVRLFSRYGYTGTTTLAIAKEAGVAEKTLFHYFHTKQELYDKAVYPLLKQLIQEKVADYGAGDGGAKNLIRDIYRDKLALINENPAMLKLTIHEFLMNRTFQQQLGEIWNSSYLPEMLREMQISEENQERYGAILAGGVTRFIVCLLFAYGIDKIYLRPEQSFDDGLEIELMLKLLFKGMEGLKTGTGEDL